MIHPTGNLSGWAMLSKIAFGQENLKQHTSFTTKKKSRVYKGKQGQLTIFLLFLKSKKRMSQIFSPNTLSFLQKKRQLIKKKVGESIEKLPNFKISK